MLGLFGDILDVADKHLSKDFQTRQTRTGIERFGTMTGNDRVQPIRRAEGVSCARHEVEYIEREERVLRYR
jgi:hypothetical protein